METFGAIVLVIFLVIVAALFPTWMLMLFLGNIGVHVGFWGAFPGGIILSSLIGASASD